MKIFKKFSTDNKEKINNLQQDLYLEYQEAIKKEEEEIKKCNHDWYKPRGYVS